MLNTEHFTLLAGKPASWDRETNERCKNGEQLTNVQIDQFNRGRESARLVKTVEGWGVHAASNLQQPQVIVVGILSKRDAIKEGEKWADECPDRREFFAAKRDMDKSKLTYRWTATFETIVEADPLDIDEVKEEGASINVPEDDVSKYQSDTWQIESITDEHGNAVDY